MIPNYMNTRPVQRPPFGLQGLALVRNGSSATLATNVRSVRFAPKTSSRNRSIARSRVYSGPRCDLDPELCT